MEYAKKNVKMVWVLVLCLPAHLPSTTIRTLVFSVGLHDAFLPDPTRWNAVVPDGPMDHVRQVFTRTDDNVSYGPK